MPSERGTAGTERRCGTCRHWTPPTGYGNCSPRIKQLPTEDWDTTYSVRQQAEGLYRICGVIVLGDDDYDRDDLPVAFTMDGSEYRADLLTQATFGCVLWEARTVEHAD